jgi:hypothetical protein
VTKTRYSTQDWDSFKKFILEHEVVDLLEKRIVGWVDFALITCWDNYGVNFKTTVAKKFVDATYSFDELVSEGNVALMRAVEKFNFALGNRFSTYATYAIQRHFFRLSHLKQVSG